MKIALYVPSWPPGLLANGIVTYASQLVPALRALGHEVFVLTPQKEATDNSDYTVDLKKFTPKRTIWNRAIGKLVPDMVRFNRASSIIASAVAMLVRDHKLDVFEIEESFGLSLAISHLKKLPVVVRIHGPGFLTARNRSNKISLRRRVEREKKALISAQLVTAPSAIVLQAVKDYYHTDLSGCVIPNSIEAASEEGVWRFATCDTEKLLFVGRFDKLKGADVVLNAFASLAKARPNLSLTFVGPDYGMEKPDGTVLLFDQFVREKLPPSCLSRVKYCGPLSHSEVMAIRPKHSVTIIASQYEVFPYSVLEAMSVGCPIVATAVGGISDLIQNGINGLLVPSQDADAMAAACEKLLDSHELAVRLGGRAWEDCRNLYQPALSARKTALAYQKAINDFRKHA